MAENPVVIATRLLLCSFGVENEEVMKNTPGRVAAAWRELLSGMGVDAGDVLKPVFEVPGADQIVALRDIPFYSVCEHHLLPFSGVAHVAYVPKGDRVVGISKLARVVDLYARRLQLQERLTVNIAEALEEHLQPGGVAVVIEGQHMCMAARGVAKPDAILVTSKLMGCFWDKPEARAEVMSLLRSNSNA